MRLGPAAAALLLTGGLAVAATPGAADVVAEEPVRLSGAGAVAGTAGIAQHRVGSALDGYAVVAWLEAVDGGGDQVMARTRAPGGAWSPPVQVSASTTGVGTAPVSAFALDVNADGDAAVAWRQQDTFGGGTENMVFAATLDRGAEAWSSARVGGEERGVSIFRAPSVAVLPDSTAVVGWMGYADEVHGQRQIYGNEGDERGWGTEVLISDTSSFPVICEGCTYEESTDLSLAADGAGEVTALFLNEADVSDGAGGTTQRLWILKTSRTGPRAWAVPTPITSVESPYSEPGAPLVVGDRATAGFASAWAVAATDTARPGVRLSQDGAVRVYRHASATYLLAGLSLSGGHAAGLLVYAESTVGHLLVVGHGPGGGDWGDPVDPAPDENLSNGPTARIGVDPDGTATVVWTAGSTRRVRITQRPAGSSVWDQPRTLHVSASSQALPLLGIAEGGTGTIVWRSSVDSVPAVFAAAFAPEAVDPEPPSLTMTGPTPLLQRVPAWTVAWEATDQGGGIGGTDVAVSETAWGEDAATTYAHEQENTAATSFSVTTNPATASGRTYCYAARGRPEASGGPGDWSAPLCTVTPVDDRTLTRVGSSWTAKSGSGRWNNTYLQTRRKGAALRLVGVHASVVGLLVEKGTGFGTVKVLLNGTLLGKVVLDGATKKRVIVRLGQWAEPRTGTLVVKVVSRDGKPVRIDGVYAGQPSAAAFPS